MVPVLGGFLTTIGIAFTFKDINMVRINALMIFIMTPQGAINIFPEHKVPIYNRSTLLVFIK